MKILIVTRNLPPLIGGMERLNWHIADELSKDNNTILLSHSDAKALAPPNCDFYGVKLHPLPIFLILVFIKTFLLCLQKKPDILFAGSGLTAPITTFWAKIFRIKSVVYIHGLDIATNHVIYNKIWVPMIRMADKVIANSSPTYDICRQKGVTENKISIIHPGVTFPPLKSDQSLIESIQDQFNLHGKKVLISVGRLTARKGMREFVNFSLPQIVSTHPNTVLVIIGDTPNQSLNKNLQSKESILSIAANHGLEENVLFVGNISNDHVLSSWYYLADVHVFPVKHLPEDPEGFGMVAIEAAAHGTPTIAFKTGGIVDAVKQNESGWLVEKNDYEALAKQMIMALKQPKSTEQCQYFAGQFEWSIFGTKIAEASVLK